MHAREIRNAVSQMRVNKFAIDMAASSTSSCLSMQSRESTTARHASHVVEGLPRIVRGSAVRLIVENKPTRSAKRIQPVAVDNKRNVKHPREVCVQWRMVEWPIQKEMKRETECEREYANRINESKEKVIARHGFVNESTQRRAR